MLSLLQKLSKRRAALEMMNGWNVEKKGKVTEILQDATMSSEDSDMETDDQGRQRLTGYRVKKLPWESNKLKKIKKKLDRAYCSSLTRRARDRVLPRREAARSQRAAPDNLPDWAKNN